MLEGVCVLDGMGVFDAMSVDEGNGVRGATLGTKIPEPVRRKVELPMQFANCSCSIETPKAILSLYKLSPDRTVNNIHPLGGPHTAVKVSLGVADVARGGI